MVIIIFPLSFRFQRNVIKMPIILRILKVVVRFDKNRDCIEELEEASFKESKSSTENGSKSVCLDMFEQELDDDLNNLGVKQV